LEDIMAGVDVGGGGGKRTVNSEINMIPFIDLLMVTIAFLLITAVWVSHTRVEATAQLPGAEAGPTPPDVQKDMHLFVTDKEFVLSWRQGRTTVSETRLPRREHQDRYPDLAEQIDKEWKLHGGHQDPSDHKLDRAVLHTENTLPFREMVAVMDAVHSAKRTMALRSEERNVSAFALAFSAK
jgi:biopolymer transport protein ExbD